MLLTDLSSFWSCFSSNQDKTFSNDPLFTADAAVATKTCANFFTTSQALKIAQCAP